MTDFRSDRTAALQTARFCGVLTAEKCRRKGGEKADYILEGKDALRKLLAEDNLLIYEKIAEKEFVEYFNWNVD